MSEIKKVVLAYSGGLDSSVILKWLSKERHYHVIAVIADIGQPEDISIIEEKAITQGAAKVYALDLREDLARDYIFPMMRAAARYEGRYLLGAAIAIPCLAHALVDIAKAEGANALAHGFMGDGNDQARFEFAVRALDPALKLLEPWREWELSDRQSLLQYASANEIPAPENADSYISASNMYHTGFEGCELEDPGHAPGPQCHSRVTLPENAPDEPEIIEAGFVRGNPVSVNGRQLAPYELIQALGEMAGRNGIGREDMVENRYAGMKCRSVYENPAGTLLFALHRDLEGICMDRELLAIRDIMSVPYSHAVYNGYWYSPEREAMQAFFDKSQESVTGLVRARLYKGNIQIMARTSPYSLFCREVAGPEGDSTNRDTAGFVHLNGRRLALYASVKKRMGH